VQRQRYMSVKRPSIVRFVALISSMLVVGGSFPLHSQSDTSGPKLLSREQHSGYVLGAGDQLNIHVVDLEEYGDKTVRIDPTGDLDLPLIGLVHAAGKSVEELRVELRQRLSKYVTSPQISLNLLTNHSSKVSVVGEVNSPSVRELLGPTTLIEAISEAGGLKGDAGSRVIVTRSVEAGRFPIDGQSLDNSGLFSTLTISLDDLMGSKRPGDNILLRPGDVVSVPKASIVYVIGDVHRSGGFPMTSRSSMSVLQAISLAEGMTSNNASRNAKILRPVPGGDGKPLEIPVNVQAIFAGKAPDPLLFAEDILYIPHSTAEAGTKRAAEIALQVATGVLIYR
jgi:polysaccharide export outer membrane protein